MSFMNLYKNRMNVRGTSIPEILRKNHDQVMEMSWYTSREVRTVRLYRHKEGTYGHQYIDIGTEDVRFIHKSIQEIASQQVEYYLQFKPGIEYPVGTYVEITDEHKKKQTWLICKKSEDMQSILYNILPCNYLFKWIAHNHICECLGVLRGLNSYSAGIKEGSVMITADNRCKLYLPTDDVTKILIYDKRLIISVEGREIPLVWKVSKIEELTPIGLSTVTVDQDAFNRDTDYSEKYGYIADINIDVMLDDKDEEKAKPIIDPHTTTEDDEWYLMVYADIRSKKPDVDGNYTYSEIQKREVKFGSTIRFRAVLYDSKDEAITKFIYTPEWFIAGIEGSYETTEENGVLFVKLNRDYNIGGEFFTVKAVVDNGKFEDQIELEVTT